ncbi:porin [Sphingorhabdus lutea]|uniref:Porin n=1 Tax=Sphingorhabdus lutea TaxID=1913578 RepID=A0A1L3JEM9_9SPHN|nr:porin [Sphingorhabdus lutea]
MGKLLLSSSAAASCLFLSINPAAAQESQNVEALQAEIAALKAQLAVLSDKVDANAKKAEDAKANEAKAQEKPAQSKEKVKWKGAPEFSNDDGWSFKPRGRILYDAATVSTPSGITDNGLGFSNEVRRARLGVQGTIPGGFEYKFEGDFANGGVELTDAFLAYAGKNVTINVGQHNNFQGLEELSSSNDTSFKERAAFTDAFGFKRKVGISAEYNNGPLLLQAGVFTDNVDDLAEDGNNSRSLDGRIVVAPKIGGNQLHLGASVHVRELGDTVTSVRYRQRPLVHSTDVRFINTGTINNATTESSYGLEAAVISGRFHAVAEGHWLKLNRTGLQDPSFDGQSIEAGVFLTNDKREYKGGVFKGVKVSNPVGKGGFGALQFNLRYDRLNLTDAGDAVFGGKQDSYQASLIWTPIDYVRFMINYAKMDYSDAAIAAAGGNRDYSVNVLGFRSQISF